jgi:hypothetical protein
VRRSSASEYGEGRIGRRAPVAYASDSTPIPEFSMRLVPLLLLLAACASTATLPPGERIGEPVEPRAIVHYAAVDANPPAFLEKTILVEAKVVAVCQNAGCWMQVEDGGKTAMVKWFTDCGGKYAFPKDLAGKTVLIQGQYRAKSMTAEEIEHRSEEAKQMLVVPSEGYEFNASAIVVLN